ADWIHVAATGQVEPRINLGRLGPMVTRSLMENVRVRGCVVVASPVAARLVNPHYPVCLNPLEEWALPTVPLQPGVDPRGHVRISVGVVGIVGAPPGVEGDGLGDVLASHGCGPPCVERRRSAYRWRWRAL